MGNSTAFPGGLEAQSAAQKLQSGSPIVWYLYADHDEFYQSGTIPYLHDFGAPSAAFTIGVQLRWANPPDVAVRSQILGYSFPGEGPQPAISLIFESSKDQHETTSISGAYIAHATAHETGHQIDSLAGQTKYSDSAEFRTAWERDLQHLNSIPACSFDASDGDNKDENGIYVGGAYVSSSGPIPDTDVVAPRLLGLFSFARDYKGKYICDGEADNYHGYGPNLQSPYSGKTNQEILALAYPRFTPPPGKTLTDYPLAELFAEEYAVLVGFPDTVLNSGADASNAECEQYRMCSNRIFDWNQGAGIGQPNGIFACTRLYVKSRVQEDRLPTANELAITGYNVPDKRQSDPRGVLYGFGSTTYFCNGDNEHTDYGFGS